MKDNPIKFGTDGWRGVIARDFTFDNVRVCAQAIADYLNQSGLARRGLVIGYDTRFASEDFAAEAAGVVAANGIKVVLCSKPAPTPVISYGVLAQQTGGAIVVTASHNPAGWNGLKVKTEDGAGAPAGVTAEIEKNIAKVQAGGKIKQVSLAEAVKQGLVERLDLAPAYFQHIAKLIDLEGLRRSGLKVIVDSMHGAGAGYLKALLDGGSIEVTEINSERNPIFPGMRQPEPIAPNLVKLSTMLGERGANVGVATDGDADRLGIVDERGTFVTTLQVYTLLCLYLLEVRGKRGIIVKTVNTSSMLYRLGEIFKVPVRETPVGFKYAAEIMKKEKVLIGGEESGGYGFPDNMPERDGIYSALCFLDLMVKTAKNPSELIDYLYSKVGAHHYDRLDVEFPEEERSATVERLKTSLPESIDGVKVARFDTTDGFRFILDDNSWLLVRFSGTEPLLRIYAESSTPARVARILKFGRDLAGI